MKAAPADSRDGFQNASQKLLSFERDLPEIAILLQSYHQECSMAKAMPASAVFLLKSVLLLMKISLSCFSI